jgi:hypothetical protein
MYAVIFNDCMDDMDCAKQYSDFWDAIDEYNYLKNIYNVELPEFSKKLCVVDTYKRMVVY